MVIGRLTGPVRQAPRPVNSEYQHAARARRSKSRPRGATIAVTDWIGLGNNQAPIQMSPEATSDRGARLLRRAVLREPGHVDDAGEQQAAVRGGLHALPLPADLRPSGAGRQHQPDPRSRSSRTPINPATGLQYAPVANYRYRGVEIVGTCRSARPTTCLASASYVTGANSMKFGYQYRKLDLLDKDVANASQLGYRFNQGVPNAVSYYLPDFGRRTITKPHSFFVQDSWTRGRLTLQGALRYDHASSFAPSELNGTTNTSFLNPHADHDPAHAGR